MAQASSKKIFFGGLYDFSSTAVDEVINRFHQHLKDPSSNSFISYDKSNKAFALTGDAHDSPTALNLAHNLKEYLDNQLNLEHHHVGHDFSESPKVRPIEGTVVEEDINLDPSAAVNGELVKVEDISEDSDDDSGMRPDGMASITAYWKPKSGNIDILSSTMAQEICQLTAASLHPEPARKRVRILGGDFNNALAKLVNLEALLESFNVNRGLAQPIAAGNVIMVAKPFKQSVIKFIRTTIDYEPAQHLLVADSAKQYLGGKCVMELRIYASNGKYSAPENLLAIDPTSTFEAPDIWADFKYLPMGSSPPSLIASPVLSAKAARSELSSIAVGVSKYLPTKTSEQIKQWSKDIAEPGDPAMVPERPKEEEVVPMSHRQRKVLVDSDDEDENTKVTPSIAPKPSTAFVSSAAKDSFVRQVNRSEATDNDSDIEQPQSSRLRLIKKDSDGSSRESEPEHPAASQKKTSSPSVNSSDNEAAAARQQTYEAVLKKYSSPPRGRRQAVKTARKASRSPANQGKAHFVTRKSSESPRPITSVLKSAVQTDSDATKQWTAWANNQSDGQAKVKASEPRSSSEDARERSLSREPSPHLSTTVPVAVGFNSRAYGYLGRNRGDRRARTQASKRQQTGRATQVGQSGRFGALAGLSSSSSNGSKASIGDKRSWPHSAPQSRADPTTRAFQGFYRTTQDTTTNLPTRDDLLIDIGTPEAPFAPIAPPPGYEVRNTSTSSGNAIPPISVDYLDSPNEQIHQPSLRPSGTANDPLFGGRQSSSGSQGSSGMSAFKKYQAASANLPVPRFDYGAVARESLAKLLEMQKQQQEQEAAEKALKASSRKGGKGYGGRPEHPALQNRKQPDAPGPVLRDTMNQGAPNPGKGKNKGQQQETPKQRQERIARVKREAFGDITPANPQRPQTPNAGSPITNLGQAVQSSKLPVIEKVITDEQTTSLINQLEPIFETARAFPGSLRLEFQIGKILIPNDQELTAQGALWPLKKWRSMFSGESNLGMTASTITTMLTANGTDLDRLVGASETKKVKLFQKDSPGRSAVTYEFQCQTKDNEEFWLVVDQSGSYALRKSESLVGFVNIHHPGHIWDACATLSGSMSLSQKFKPEILSAIKTFVESLYIGPEEKKVSISYRLPTTNAVTVRKLIMKRVSLHSCVSEGRADLKLKVTEVKTLYHRFNKADKKIAQGFEKDWPIMVEDGRVHYEASIVSRSVNDVLACHNTSLEMGELTDPNHTGKALLKFPTISNLLDLTTVVISKMDWMGASSKGTLIRNIEEEHLKQLRLSAIHGGPAASIILPTAAGRLPFTATGLASTTYGGRYRTPNNTADSAFGDGVSLSSATATARPVRGVRMNTVAGFVEREGRWYRHGQGGAMVPVPEIEAIRLGLKLDVIREETGSLLGSELVLGPDDSASQAGGIARGGGVSGRRGRLMSETEAVRKGFEGDWYKGWAAEPKRPDGFW